MTAPSSTALKAECPHCGPDRNADVRGEFRVLVEDGFVWHETIHRILQCRGCDNVYHQEQMRFSEDEEIDEDHITGEIIRHIPPTFNYWPARSKRRKPEWIEKIHGVDGDLYYLLDETYSALNNDQHVLAAIGVRTALDRASELLGVDTQLPFAAKLDALEKSGTIGGAERRTLSAVTDAGSAAAHRGWRPTLEVLDAMMTSLEAFLHRAFVAEVVAVALKNSVPQRSKAKPPPKMPG